ncbi:hypothetical protein WJX73_006006 [Symbiochloris irregularis]|uniref:Secreted protein n=1 Tax=Symbiochloris irregularis TaxID=706552 RepID=A0AAW1P8B6_9CHLO
MLSWMLVAAWGLKGPTGYTQDTTSIGKHLSCVPAFSECIRAHRRLRRSGAARTDSEKRRAQICRNFEDRL